MPQVDDTRRIFITIVVMVATLMQSLDATIANVALPHMQGSLSASQDQISWVVTSYAVSTAISLLLTPVLSERLGSRQLLIFAVGGFTAASVLCSTAQGISEMVLFRVMQGAASAWIVPVSQTVLMQVYPREKQAQAISNWGMGVTLGPILGPTVGGYLTEHLTWRWVFLINLPIGIVTVAAFLLLLPKPERAPRRSFDAVGFGFMALTLASLQLMLDRGQTQDWFGSIEIIIEGAVAALAFYLFVTHVLTTPKPFVTPDLYRNWNFSLSLVLTLAIGALPSCMMVLMPLMMQNVMGYPVQDAGMLMAPRGIGMMFLLAIGVRLIRLLGPRTLMFVSLMGTALTAWRISGFTTDTPAMVLVTTGLLQGMTLGGLFLPMNVLVFQSLEPRFITEAASMSMIARGFGGSIAVSVMFTLLSQNGQIARADLTSYINPFSRSLQAMAANETLANAPTALAMISGEIDRQAAMTAFVDNFHVLMVLACVLAPLVLLLRPPRTPPTAPDSASVPVEA